LRYFANKVIVPEE